MELEFPYQIVTFLDNEPSRGESVYNGENGWYPQVTLKRRFKLENISEHKFIDELKAFFESIDYLSIITDALTKPERMPVQVIHIANQEDLKQLHNRLLEQFSAKITSRYPNREGDNYYPHVTAEFENKFVIEVDKYSHKEYKLKNVWLLKDLEDENSVAYTKIY